MIETLILVVMFSGLFFTTLYGKPKTQAYGWLTVSLAVATNIIRMILLGKYLLASLNFGVLIMDLYLFYKYMKIYERSLFDNRAKFLDELVKFRKK